MKRIRNVCSEESNVRGTVDLTEVDRVGHGVQQPRQYDAFTLADQRVDLGAVEVPDKPVLDGPVRTSFTDEAQAVERSGGHPQLPEEQLVGRAADCPPGLDHVIQEGRASGRVIFGGPIVFPTGGVRRNA